MVKISQEAQLRRLALLIQQLNVTLGEISAIVGRPAQLGHVGESIASAIFDIKLHDSAVTKGQDGLFGSQSPLAGRSVNVKWYPTDTGLLDLSPDESAVDTYLVLTGPITPPISSRNTTRPWRIDSVYLFSALDLLSDLKSRRVGIGTASSVRRPLWDAAMVYPDSRNPLLSLTRSQRELLSLFSAPGPG